MIPIIIISVIFLDQFTKAIAAKILQLNNPFPVIKNFLDLTLVHNRGAAFGIFQNQLYAFIFLSVCAIILIVLNLKDKKNSVSIKFSLSMILGGAIGNLIDRLRFGFVVDFIDLRVWPVFNLADSAITIAAFLLAWDIIFKKDAA